MRTIKFKVSGRGADTDAPTVADLLDQIRDYFDVLNGVEQAVALDGKVEIEWRIIGASKNSPLSFEAAAFARQYAMNVDMRAEAVLKHTANGFKSLQTRQGRPPFFSEKVLVKVERIFERVTNGLSETDVDYGPDLPGMILTRGNAYAAAVFVEQILRPPAKAYKEIGSIEGIAHGFDKDGWGYPSLKIKHRLTGDEISCRLAGQALQDIEARHVGEVLRDCRVQLSGVIHFKALGKISRVDATAVRFLRRSSELPGLDEIFDEGFTGGLRSEDYLERLRNGGIS
ncbi:MAG TPA: hypothetical protein VIE65_15395 [Methylobacter sp.]|jgi:hypothetical protein